MDQLIAEIVKGIRNHHPTEPHQPRLRGCSTIMKGGGVTMMLYGEMIKPEEVVTSRSTIHC